MRKKMAFGERRKRGKKAASWTPSLHYSHSRLSLLFTKIARDRVSDSSSHNLMGERDGSSKTSHRINTHKPTPTEGDEEKSARRRGGFCSLSGRGKDRWWGGGERRWKFKERKLICDNPRKLLNIWREEEEKQVIPLTRSLNLGQRKEGIGSRKLVSRPSIALHLFFLFTLWSSPLCDSQFREALF